MSTEEKRLREQRGLVPSWSFLTCLRRPYLFRLAGKDGGRKGALGYDLVRAASDFRQVPMFSSVVPLGGHPTSFCYAPPDTGVSNLILVALEYLPAIEGVDGILMDGTFLRGRRGIDPWDRDGNSFSL